MKAISLLQPWASLVVMGLKTIETRSWATRHRGIILIHASQGKSGSIFAEEKPFKNYIPDFNALPFGAIIGSVIITGVVPVTHTGLPEDTLAQLTKEEKAFGDYSGGRFAWLLVDAVAFKEPLPARGMLNVWDYEGALPRMW
ncbi:MAG: ASCH domain-containing protein [Bacteroidota bacterium]